MNHKKTPPGTRAVSLAIDAASRAICDGRIDPVDLHWAGLLFRKIGRLGNTEYSVFGLDRSDVDALWENRWVPWHMLFEPEILHAIADRPDGLDRPLALADAFPEMMSDVVFIVDPAGHVVRILDFENPAGDPRRTTAEEFATRQIPTHRH